MNCKMSRSFSNKIH